MNYRPLYSSYSYTNYLNYSQQQQPLSIVPRLSSTRKYICFRVCQSFRNRSNARYMHIWDNNTVEQLKEEIQKRFNITANLKDFSLTRFDESEDTWMPIYDSNDHKTIADLNLPSYTILNVEIHEATNINQQHTSKIIGSDLTLKLCKRPMDKTDCLYLDIHSSITISQLKEEAQKRVTNQRTDHLQLWTKDGWTKFETSLNDINLAELGFDQYSIISFESEDDPVPGVCGLINLGNTCFMNSALQCLSNIPELTRKILSFGNEMNAPIIGAYSALIEAMWSGKNIVTTPSSLLLDIRENLPRFSRYRQQDAQEFMNYFLHLIHQEFTNEKTLITDLFYGQIRSSVKCLRGCRSIEVNEETISFLPLPIENDINQYNILYLRSNGEQCLVSVRTCARTIDALINSFIEQHEPNLSSRRIEAVKIVDYRIVQRYSASKSLNDTTKDRLTFIEIQEKSTDQKYVELAFRDRQTCKPFRPPVFLLCPSAGCRYSDLSEQLNQIQNHLCSVTNAPPSACQLQWIDDNSKIQPLNTEMNRSGYLPFLDRIIIEMDSEWVQKYKSQYNFDQPIEKTSLNSLLADFFHEEPLNGNYYCSTCSDLKEAKQKADLALPLPLVLIIQVKRFTYDIHSDTKIDTYIDFPLKNLDLSQYVTQDDKKHTDILALYDLVAVSNHTGTLVSGHYTTYARNDLNKTWYSFNDEITREIINEKDIVTKNAYILVYVKRTAL